MNITSNFPGGNITVERTGSNDVSLHQDLRDTIGPWFYWHFHVTGASGQVIRFNFTQSPAIGARGPAVSNDGGLNWQWLGDSAPEDNTFEYRFSSKENAVSFASAIPYTQANWSAFLAQHASNKHIRSATLVETRQGRTAECLYLGSPARTARRQVLITARHHACETMGSYVLEGMISFMLAQERASAWLRENVALTIIPFMDKDGVENGDQGKNRAPRDHNRDYEGRSHHVETAALRQMIPQWLTGVPFVFLDLHCPWLRGDGNEELFLVGSSSDAVWKEQQKFSNLLETTSNGPISFRKAANVPFGTSWNNADNYKQGKSATRWATELPNAWLVSSIEVPYANAGGTAVTPHSARAAGVDIARALAHYLQDIDA